MRRLLGVISIACTMACSGRQVTQYTGSAMNDATPESAGSFKLTLYARTDTSFSGVLELGAPLPGAGPAYVWQEGTVLKIVTVAARGNDTTVWTSNRADTEVGGRFEITGGEHAGQGGTWRARLTSGPAATQATLRQPQQFPLPPVSSLWPLLLLAASVVGIARWVRAAPSPPTGIDTGGIDPPSDGSDPRREIGGWLALFLLGQSIAILVAIATVIGVPASLRGTLPVGSIVYGMRSLLLLESGIQVLLPVLVLVGIVLAVRRDWRAPRFWFAYLSASAVYLLIDLAASAHVHAEMVRLLGARYETAVAKDHASTQVATIRQVFLSLVWALYWIRSERVRDTFGSAALDRSARPFVRRSRGADASNAAALEGDAGAEVGRDASEAPPSRGGRRRAMKVAGAIVGVLTILVALTAWAGRVRPYSIPQGADIRTQVAGRWDWTSHSAPCTDSAHVIAFPGDGKVMTITQQSRWVDSLGRDRSVATYDILRTTSSSIRGAIRGEERLTSDGRPVVWDLVLVGPNEYRWHRTDWPSVWGYTRSIIRCGAGAPAPPPRRSSEVRSEAEG